MKAFRTLLISVVAAASLAAVDASAQYHGSTRGSGAGTARGAAWSGGGRGGGGSYSHGGYSHGGYSHGGYSHGGYSHGGHHHGGHHHGGWYGSFYWGFPLFWPTAYWGYPYYGYGYGYPYYYDYPPAPYDPGYPMSVPQGEMAPLPSTEVPLAQGSPTQGPLYMNYCESAHAYFPKVTACPEGWKFIAPNH